MFSDDDALRLPYPGLRSFQREESDLFFGREGSVNDMINRLRPHHFLAVLGTSGSGKSSLVRIGLLDGLELGLLAEAGPNWRIADFAPGNNPIRNLARELVRLSNGEEIDVDFVEAMLARGPRSVIEWCEDGNLPPKTNLLLLVDQFEELFRYQGYAQRQAAEAFVALLIESARAREVPIYVVLTMRTDFLGACALIQGLAEAINDGQYLTPRLTREQCREAIVGPASVCGTAIEEPLINRLLNDLEDFAPWDDRDTADQLDRLVRRADQLPLLQHTLNRLWLRADAERRDPDAPILLRLSDYEAIGGLRGAIDAHAEEILGKLGPDRLRTVELVFRALTDGKSLATAVRRPTPLSELIDVCNGKEADVRAVVEAFRAPGVNFLRPDTSVPLQADTIVDISHESLIRQWRRLSTWLQAESRKAQEWMRLGEAAARYRAGAGARYHGQDLHVWLEHARPTEAWARRYNQPYRETLAFLDESLAAERKQTFWRRAVTIATFLIVVVFGGGGFLLWQLLSANSDLTASQQALEAKNAELAALSETVQEQAAAAVEARDKLDALVAEASDVFRNSVDSNIGEYQHSGNWSAAGALVGALLKDTSIGAGDRRAYDPALLSAVRGRLAEQWSYAVWNAEGLDSALKTQPGRYGLGIVYESSPPAIRAVDRLSGAVLAETALPTSADVEAAHYISADGKVAVIVDIEGRAYRWDVGSGEPQRLASLGAPGRDVRALAFDRESGRLAAILHTPDSILTVVQAATPHTLFEYRLADVDGLAGLSPGGGGGKGFQLDGHTLAFWNGNPLVGVALPGDYALTFAAIDLDTEFARILPGRLYSAMPTPDGRHVFATATEGCGYYGDIVPAGGRMAPDTLETMCLGIIRSPDSAFEVIGPLRAINSSYAIGEMQLADVMMASELGPSGYRVILDDGAEAVPGSSAARLAIAIAVSDAETRVVPAGDLDGGDDQTPLVAASYREVPGFVRSYPLEPWVGLERIGPTVAVDVSDAALAAELAADAFGAKPTAEAREPIATIAAIGAAGVARGIEIQRNENEWYADILGDYRGVVAARNDTATLVIAGTNAALWEQSGAHGTTQFFETLELDDSCSFGDEGFAVSTVHPWNDKSPAFLAITTRGRVMRIERRAFTGGAAEPVATGPTQRPESADAAGETRQAIVARCIGQVRAEPAPIVIPSFDGNRLLLQTEPAALRSLGPSVDTAAAFNAAPKIPLAGEPLLATTFDGDTRIASLDTIGYLSIQQASRPFNAIGGQRTGFVDSPIHLSAVGTRLLIVGRYGEAVIVDASGDDQVPVAAGRVPRDASLYWLEADGQTVGAIIAGKVWRAPLIPLPPVERLGRYAEGTAAAVGDPTDRALVALGKSLVSGRGDGAVVAGELALSPDAVCFLAADAVIAAWESEEEEGVESARLVAARAAAAAACTGNDGLAQVGRSLSTAPRSLMADAPWPVEWSVLLKAAHAGDALAKRALAVGLTFGSDQLARAAGAWVDPAYAAAIERGPDATPARTGSARLADGMEADTDSYDPAVHEQLGVLASRSGADMAKIKEAWVHYRIAEILYGQQVGREADAARMAARRAALARVLPGDELLSSWEEAARWVGKVPSPEMPAGTPAAELAPRLEADAAMLAAEGAPEGFRLLGAYLWTSLAEQGGAGAAAAYAAAGGQLAGLPPVQSLDAPVRDALVASTGRLAPIASEATALGHDLAARVAALLVALAEAGTVHHWEADGLADYVATLAAANRLWPQDLSAVSEDGLDRARFAADRFRTLATLPPAGTPEGDALRPAARAALEARLALLDRLVERDATRADWLAARGATRFWLFVYAGDGDADARDAGLRLAIADLSEAQARMGDNLEPMYVYWLAESRRWLGNDDSDATVALLRPAIAEYERLLAVEQGSDMPYGSRGNLLAAQAEILGKIADALSRALVALPDDWSLDDPAIVARYLDALYAAAEWDRKRVAAIEAGSNSRSVHPGYAYGAGYVVGSLAGRLGLAAGRETPDACEVLTAFAGDPLRRAPHVAFDAIAFDGALPACRTLLAATPDSARLAYHGGRALWHDEAARYTTAVDLLVQAADAGYGAAFNSLAAYASALPATNPDANEWSVALRNAYTQRTIRDGFSATYDFLAAHAATAEHVQGLHWLAERAGALGMVEAQLILADLAGSEPGDAERAFHLEIAARLVEDDDPDRAREIRDMIAPKVYVDASDRVDDGWDLEKLEMVPAGLVDAIKAPPS